MSVEEPLMADAERRTGLDSWGEVQSFRVGLRVLLSSLEEADLPEDVALRQKAGWIDRLSARLRLVEHRRRHPEITDERVEAPLIVIGLPRTGTTVLADLLALDPRARSPLQWETPLPWPPPAREKWHSDPRIAEAEDRAAAAAEAFPEIASQHSMGALFPEECNAITMIDFWSPNFWASHSLPRYESWLAHSRIDQPYRTHHWILQHLQHHGPAGRWTLKSPFHQFDLPALLAEYPDAMLVHTHRDPVAITASNASLIAAVRGLPAGDPQRTQIGPSNVALWSAGIRRGLAARCDPAIDARVFDISNRALNSDPVGSVKRIYEHFDLPFTDEYAVRLRQWTDQPTQPTAGKRYSLEEHGLDRAGIEAAYAEYRRRFADYLE